MNLSHWGTATGVFLIASVNLFTLTVWYHISFCNEKLQNHPSISDHATPCHAIYVILLAFCHVRVAILLSSVTWRSFPFARSGCDNSNDIILALDQFGWQQLGSTFCSVVLSFSFQLGNTALHIAAEAGYQKVVKLLVEFGASPLTENKVWL